MSTNENPGPKQQALEFYRENTVMVFIITALILAGIIYGIAQALTVPTKNEAASTPQETSLVAGTPNTPTPTPTQITPAPEETILSGGNNPQAPGASDDWEPIAQQFAEAWANPEGGRDQWLARIQPLVDEVIYHGFENTNFEQYISAKEVDRTEVTTIDGPDIGVKVFYKDNPQTPEMTILLSPAGENMTYRVVQVF